MNIGVTKGELNFIENIKLKVQIGRKRLPKTLRMDGFES